MYMRMFTAALFAIANMQNQPESPLKDGWINKMRCTHKMEYYSAARRKKVLIYATPWMDLENITLSERGRHQRHNIL